MASPNTQKNFILGVTTAVFLAVTTYVSTRFLDFQSDALVFRGEVLVGLAELRAESKQQTADIAELRRLGSDFVTEAWVKDFVMNYVELQLLKKK